MAEHLTELQSYHSHCTSCEVSIVRSRWCLVSLSCFIKIISRQCCSYIRLDTSETSQYEVLAFDTKKWHQIKCIDVRLALYNCSQYVGHFCRN